MYLDAPILHRYVITILTDSSVHFQCSTALSDVIKNRHPRTVVGGRNVGGRFTMHEIILPENDLTRLKRKITLTNCSACVCLDQGVPGTSL